MNLLVLAPSTNEIASRHKKMVIRMRDEVFMMSFVCFEFNGNCKFLLL